MPAPKPDAGVPLVIWFNRSTSFNVFVSAVVSVMSNLAVGLVVSIPTLPVVDSIKNLVTLAILSKTSKSDGLAMFVPASHLNA